LRRLALRGSAVETGGYAVTQVLRLVSNVVLSRLLFPEAFGLSALVTIILIGVTLLSDVGLEPAVVQNRRGDDPRFLDTVWTLKVVRGALLWGLCSALAWPFAALYSEPELIQLLPVGALSAVLHGLSSTSLLTLRRRVDLAPLAILEVASKVMGVGVMVIWALIHPSVWALIAGSLVEAACHCAGSYMMKLGPAGHVRNRFGWDPEAARAVIHFGKWIFGSSAVFFFGRQGDRLLLGKFLGIAWLGIYNIAVFLSEAALMLIDRITHGVFFPIFSEAARDGDERLKRVYYSTRLRLDWLALPSVGALAVLGPSVVELLYDDRYVEAGWMLQALCIRVAMGCVLGPCETCLFARGQTRYGFYRNVVRTAWIWIGIPIGWSLAGIEGLVWATALSEIPVLLVLWLPFHRFGLLRPSREAGAVVAFLLGIVLGSLTNDWIALPALEWLHG
jgi:O-antigen/teichoic acid export membrane protein